MANLSIWELSFVLCDLSVITFWTNAHNCSEKCCRFNYLDGWLPLPFDTFSLMRVHERDRWQDHVCLLSLKISDLSVRAVPRDAVPADQYWKRRVHGANTPASLDFVWQEGRSEAWSMWTWLAPGWTPSESDVTSRSTDNGSVWKLRWHLSETWITGLINSRIRQWWLGLGRD